MLDTTSSRRQQIGILAMSHFSSSPTSLVSVIIPTRGSKPRSLSRAVASIFGQTAILAGTVNVEVLICLDGVNAQLIPDAVNGEETVSSEEGLSNQRRNGCALSLSERSVLEDNRVRAFRLVPSSGGRPGLVRNVALRAALQSFPFSGDPSSSSSSLSADHWIAFLDDDDEWVPHKLEVQIDRMRSDCTLMVCGGGIEQQQSNEDTPSRNFPTFHNPPTMPRCAGTLPPVLTGDHLLATNVIVASSMMIHHSIAVKTGEFNDQRYGQDYEYWKRCFIADSTLEVSGVLRPSAQSAVVLRAEPRRGRCSFVAETLVLYGVGGLQRSSVEKEVRQSVQAVVQNAFLKQPVIQKEKQQQNGNEYTTLPKETRQTRKNHSGTAKETGGSSTQRLPADLINGFLGFQ